MRFYLCRSRSHPCVLLKVEHGPKVLLKLMQNLNDQCLKRVKPYQLHTENCHTFQTKLAPMLASACCHKKTGAQATPCWSKSFAFLHTPCDSICVVLALALYNGGLNRNKDEKAYHGLL